MTSWTRVSLMGTTLLMGIAGLSGIPGTARAATHVVTTCADSGAGSLRAAVGSAASGDTIDLGTLACRRIVLTSGAILIPQSSLSIRGPGFARLAVSGNYHSSVFRHSGLGKLTLRGMAIEQGQHRADYAEGGCVYSAGEVDVTDVHIRHCAAYAKFGALGGGIYAQGNISLYYSAVYSNGAKGAYSSGGGVVSGRILAGPVYIGGRIRAHRTRFLDNAAGSGGAIRALDGLVMTYSTVANNRARHSSGGFEALSVNGGPTRIAYSTITGNSALYSVGAFSVAPNVSSIENSTISGNSSPFISVAEIGPGVTIANSTIAFNATTTPFGCIAAVVVFVEVHVESSILARNTCNGEPTWDIGNNGGTATVAIIGADNLFQTVGAATIPSDTITGVDPLLGPLADNGGRTLTHLPATNSPAINRGNNVIGFDFDQRGEGFPRVKGTRTDIGAVER